MENRKLIISKMKLVFHLFSSGYLKDLRLLRAFLETELKEFIPKSILDLWPRLMRGANLYDDTPLIFYFNMEHQQSSRTISAPHMISIMLQELDLKENDDLLILGAKSGYIAALAQKLAPKGEVLILEANTKIAEITSENIKRVQLGNKIQVLVQNPLKGYVKSKPWQKILITGAIKQERIYPLLYQLDPDEGVLFAPIGEGFDQTYTQIIRMGDKFFGKKHLKVRFTPLITQLELDQLKLVPQIEGEAENLKNFIEQNNESPSNISIKYITKVIESINLDPQETESFQINLPNILTIYIEFLEKWFSSESSKYRYKILEEVLDNIKQDLLFEKQELKSYLDKIKGNELITREIELIKKRLEIIESFNINIEDFEKLMDKEFN